LFYKTTESIKGNLVQRFSIMFTFAVQNNRIPNITIELNCFSRLKQKHLPMVFTHPKQSVHAKCYDVELSDRIRQFREVKVFNFDMDCTVESNLSIQPDELLFIGTLNSTILYESIDKIFIP
jgi:hypothetical protein